MIAGRIAVERFAFQVADAEGKRVVDGLATQEPVPIKLLIFQEQSGLQFFFTFSVEEFEQFCASISGKKIIPANFIPPLDSPNARRL